MHGSSAAVAGEFAIVPPFLGSSQRLLNRDHYSVYYKVRDVICHLRDVSSLCTA